MKERRTLPETSGFGAVSGERWRALGDLFRSLDVAQAYERVAAVGGGLFEPACMPLRRWHLRRSARPADHAARMFCVDDPVTETEAKSALGDTWFEELLGAGLLVRRASPEGGDIVSPFRLREHDGVYFFSDHLWLGGDAVMGAGPLTGALLAAAAPSRKIDAALDLGCGAGLVALSLARHAGRVVATDINPRAAPFVRANAALNGLSNIDVRTGDLFAPVAGERFDVLACQPPFFPTPPDLAKQVYQQGGSRGDELALEVVRSAGAHLSPGGRAAVISEWPLVDDTPLTERLRAVIGGEMSLLVLEGEGPDADAFCISDNAYSHPDFGPEFREKAVRLREHMASLGIRGLRVALSILEPAGASHIGAPSPSFGQGFTGSFEVSELSAGGEIAALVESQLAAHRLLHAGREAVLSAKLRLREGTVFASGKDALLRVIFAKGGPLSEVRLDRGAHRVIELCDTSPDGHAASKRFVKEASGPRSVAADRFAAAVEQLLRAGILEVAGR